LSNFFSNKTIFLYSLLFCTEPVTQNTYSFAYAIVAHGTNDMGYILQHFHKQFFHDTSFETVMKINHKSPVEVYGKASYDATFH
jgi:hypothetical protein